MFSVYGITGPIFQGPLEKLALLPPVRRARPIEALHRIGDLDAADVQQPDTLGAAPGPAEQAVAEYRSMLPRELERGPLYHAGQIMQKEVITVRADDPVTRGWQTLIRHRIRQAPVVDSNTQLVGIVSERDLLTCLNVDADQIRDALARQVADVMTTPVVAANTLTDIRRIARVMIEHNVDGVPIVGEDGVLLGFVSRSDILRAVVTDPPLSVWQ